MNDYGKMEQWEVRQLKQLQAAVGQTVELTEAEARILRWLAGWDTSTVDAMCSIIGKIRDQR